MARKHIALLSVVAALGMTTALILLARSPVPVARASEFTVCSAGPPDCAFSSVQEAVFAANDGDLIKIAGGVYTGVQTLPGLNTSYLTATQMVAITETLTLRGGYTVTNWTTPDPVASPTTLDAQDLGRVVLVSGDTVPYLEGLRFVNGNADGLGGRYQPWNEMTADVGAGIYVVTATLTVSNCELVENRVSANPLYGAANFGGALYATSPVELYNSLIANNRGECTSGVYLESSDGARVQGNEFIDNSTLGGNCYTGGGLSARGNDVLVQGNLFEGNNAYGGGGLGVSGVVIVKDNRIVNNRAIYGGGLHVQEGTFTLSGNVIIGNNASQAGGGISAFNGRPRALLVNNLIAGNTVSTWDGRHCGSLDGGSAVLAFAGSALTLTHNTIARNRFPTCADNAILVSGTTVTLTNNIVVSHGLGITVTAGSMASLDGTLWGAGAWANGTDWAGDGTILTGTINIWGDPGFVDVDADDYHIGLDSAARDAGVETNVAADIDGDLRPQGAGYDIGADELPFCDTVTEIPTAECEALVALYNSTDGSNWGTNTGWLETSTPCGWYGVSCSGGHVSYLDLRQNHLSGIISPELGDLSSLQALTLYGNQLSGSIPPELGNLANLQELRLSFNQLGGTIPLELGSLAMLQDLDLGRNQLIGLIPPELGAMSSLNHLDLTGNQLMGAIPPELGSLANLHSLELGYNQLSGIIPPEFGDMVSLVRLYLGENQLSGIIPPELGELDRLEYLYLGGNHLSGPIPGELGALPILYTLGLYANQLSGAIPPEIGNLSSLQQLLLQGNTLEGEIPASITNLTQLGSPRLDYNSLMASDPAVALYLKQRDPEWAHTQTVPPTDLQVTTVTADSLQLSWEPITYTWDGGYYEVSYATVPGGPYTIHGTTLDKTASGYMADGLSPDTTHYLVVRAYTPSHDYQQNDLWSGYSEEVSATTTVDLGSLNLAVDLQGRDDDSGALFTAWSGGQEAGSCTSTSDGTCSILLTAGTYSVTVEMASYLDGIWDSVSISDGESASLPTVTLLGGDTNDDCVINIQDLAFMGYRFNACEGDPLYDVRGDINADGCINILDLAMAGGNFGGECLDVCWCTDPI